MGSSVRRGMHGPWPNFDKTAEVCLTWYNPIPDLDPDPTPTPSNANITLTLALTLTSAAWENYGNGDVMRRYCGLSMISSKLRRVVFTTGMMCSGWWMMYG